jgi:hypothetical protein
LGPPRLSHVLLRSSNCARSSSRAGSTKSLKGPASSGLLDVALPEVSMAASSPNRFCADDERTSDTGSSGSTCDEHSSSGCAECTSRARFFARMRLMSGMLGSTRSTRGRLSARWAARAGDLGLLGSFGLIALVDRWPADGEIGALARESARGSVLTAFRDAGSGSGTMRALGGSSD